MDLPGESDASGGLFVRHLLTPGPTSLPDIELRTDEWGVDVVITASQKGLMALAGLTLVSVSDRAWDVVKIARLPRCYWSFERMRTALADGLAFTPFTPAINVLYGLHARSRMIEAHGLQAWFARHRYAARAVRAGIRALGT
jgi:aspartate aminotransferase-like enzyme